MPEIKVETPAVDTQQKPASAPAQEPVKPVQTPPPAVNTSGASPVPAQEDKVVPITALHEEREKRQALQAELEALKKVAGQNVLFDIQGNPVQMQQAPVDHRQEQYKQEMDKLWESDPRRAVQAEIYTAMTWRDNQEAQLDRQEVQVANANPDFNNYRSEVRNYLRTLPLEQRATPGIVEMAYYIVRGQKVDNIIAKTKETMEADYRAKMASGDLAQGMPSGSMSQPPSIQGQVVLTPEQKSACVAFGITEAEYVKNMKR